MNTFFFKQHKIKGMLASILAVLLCAGCTSTMVSTSGTSGSTDTAPADSSLTASSGTSEAPSGGSTEGDGEQSSESDTQGAIFADIEIQDVGTITVQLDPSAAPGTVENFVSLAESGFYDGLTFHRIMDGFMMQGGAPGGDGAAGSENQIRGEFSANGFDNPLSHTRGAISMARAQDMDSASSQFFIVQSDSTFLDGQYAAFGYVTSGIEFVDQICSEAKPVDNNGTILPEEQPVMAGITIRTE